MSEAEIFKSLKVSKETEMNFAYKVMKARLEEFNVRSVSRGKDALGEVRVTINVNGRHYHGRGVSTDIIEAAALSYMQALNKVDEDRRTQIPHRAEAHPANP